MTNALTTTSDTPMLPSQSEWSLMRDMAAQLVPTRFLPESIKTAEQAVAIMLKGRELRVPPMYALSNIAVVKGKPTVSAEMMLALIYRDHGKQAIRVKQSTNEFCTVEYRTEGWEGTSEYTFSIEDARKAGLSGNVWSSYPAAMLRARCISAVARMAFPESIAGMYVPGELGDDVTVSDEGEVITAPQFSASVVAERPANVAQLAPQNVDPDRAMKRIHAVAAKRGITHEMLHAKFEEMGHASLSDVPSANLDNLANRIEQQDNAFLGAEWGRFGWQPAADPETGEVIDVTPNQLDRDEEKARLWRLVHDTFGWSVADLAAVMHFEVATAPADATAEQFQQIYQTVVVMSPDERDAVLTSARAAA